jgi:hypothetical protein
LPWWDAAQVLQDQPDTLTVLVADAQTQNTVKVSFFGGLSIGRVAEPDPTADGVAIVAAPLDLLGTKLKVMLQGAERKDYEDVAVLLRSGLSLEQRLAAARALDGSVFPCGRASRPWSSSTMATWATSRPSCACARIGFGCPSDRRLGVEAAQDLWIRPRFW